MSHTKRGNRGAVPRGSKPPKKGDMARTQRQAQGRSYQLAGGVPWPELGDGTPYIPEMRVRHRDYPDFVGKVQWSEYRDADGNHLKERTKPATKTKGERPVEGAAWWAVVAWDKPDDPDRPLTRLPMKALEAEQ